MLHLLFWGLFPALTLMCVYASIRFFLRYRTEAGSIRWVWLALLSLIGGGLGWTVHYVTITMISPGDQLIWSLPHLGVSFAVGVSCLGISVWIAGRAGPGLYQPVFALFFAGMISTGNILIFATAQAQGSVDFDERFALLAVGVGLVMAYLGANFTAKATTLRNASSGAVALAFLTPVQDMILLHATTVTHDPAAPMPDGFAPDMILLIMLVSCAVVVLLVGTAGLMIDRALEREATARYRVLATTDALTGLSNRTGFMEALTAMLERGQRIEQPVLVAAIDLDKFKPINDLYGHATGDDVLIEVARRLRELSPPDSEVARIGGDEFILACPLPPDADPAQEAERLAQDLLTAIGAPIPRADTEIAVGVSVGLSLAPQHGATGLALINAADIALYRVKAKACGFILYDTAMGQENLRRARVEVDIANALKSGQFELYYQPQVNLISGVNTGFEALIRWQHPERGLIMPGAFIPIAESSSLIADIGRWVLQEACRTAATWPDRYGVAVNVAARQLSQPDFIAIVEAALAEADLPAHRLEIELTEASVIEDQAQALRVMHELRALGVRLAMDDYGTGYASLSALRTFPFDKLKIDRSFISGVEDDSQLAAIVKSTLFLTKALSIPVVAEGVESRKHVDFLIREGCEDVQGYFYGRPMPAEAVLAQIAADSRLRKAS